MRFSNIIIIIIIINGPDYYKLTVKPFGKSFGNLRHGDIFYINFDSLVLRKTGTFSYCI